MSLFFYTPALVFDQNQINIIGMNSILAIETSVPQASVTLWQNGEISYAGEFTTDRNHNSMIFDPLAQALDTLKGEKLSVVLAGTGPGSYSGTRVGIAAIQGVAIAHQCPSVGIGSLAATPIARADGPSLAVGDARRGLYFISEISSSGEAMDAELLDADTLQRRLTEADEKRLFTLDDPAQFNLDENLTQRIARSRPEARWLVDIWLNLPSTRQNELKLKPLAPAYLRPPFTSKAKAGHPLLR